MKVILNPGEKDPYHGVPSLIRSIEKRLEGLNIEHLTLTPNSEMTDRVRMINRMSRNEDYILLTIESKDGPWSVNVAYNSDGKSRALAQILAVSAEKRVLVSVPRVENGGQKYWKKTIPVCSNTACPSVLIMGQPTENLEDIRETVIEGLCNYLGIQYDII